MATFFTKKWKRIVILLSVVGFLIAVITIDSYAFMITLRKSYKVLQDQDPSQSYFSNTPAGYLPPKTNIVFLKVHKAASTTVQNILLRYALFHKLNVLLSKGSEGIHINEHSDVISENKIMSVPPNTQFNILTHHLIFNKKHISRFFPPDTVYVGIVREPYSRFVSSIYYYGTNWNYPSLKNLIAQNSDPVNAFLTNPHKYDLEKSRSFLNNRMSRDFGMPLPSIKRSLTDNRTTESFVKRVTYDLDLVLVTEHFDASVIMLKRLMNWTFKDILYIKINQLNTNVKRKTIANDRINRALYKKFAPSEFALYEHFLSIFLDKVKALGQDFAEEVEAFRQARQIVENFCAEIRGKINRTGLEVERTKWSLSFKITPQYCDLLEMNEGTMTDIVRLYQNNRLMKFLNEALDSNMH